MSIWSDIQDRSSGETVRKEDYKCSVVIQKYGRVHKVTYFYVVDYGWISLSPEQTKNLRGCYFKAYLKDERSSQCDYIDEFFVITTPGNTGEDIVRDAFERIEKKLGLIKEFEEDGNSLHRSIKLGLVKKLITKHNLEMVGSKVHIGFGLD